MKKTKKPVLTMKYAGGLIKHLGLQMYSGAVPSIAELVKNAYDANATELEILIPFDFNWNSASTIEVSDNGNGMSFSELDKKYLVIGRDRRKEQGDLVEGNATRRPIGRKGIGKLAGFGIAETIKVTSIRNGKRSQFEMNYRDIESLQLGKPYHPKVIEAEITTSESPGTRVILQGIKLQRPITAADFRYSMAKRFALLSSDFIIRVNGQPLNRDEVPLQFRFPEQINEDTSK